MPDTLDPLREQLTAAAEAFGEGREVDAMLREMIGDVEKAAAEPLEIYPVCHHSPASALFMVQRLQEKAPKVIFMEMCEDLQPLLAELSECQLPVALQAFASTIEGFPVEWSPLSLVAPLTQFSAEYQAIAYSMQHEDCELIFVDRSVDHFFQWKPREPEGSDSDEADGLNPEEMEERGMHGSAEGVQLGDLRPRFPEFEEFLLKNAQVKHYSEWWDQYVEQPLIGASYETYRMVYFLIGSLFRRLGTVDDRRLQEDRLRESFMWTRMKQHLAAHPQLRPEDCLYICGAFHASSDVPEYGSATKTLAEIGPRTPTHWLYGIIPSSHSAIEWQFGLPWGSISLAAATWQKALKQLKLKPYEIGKTHRPGKAVPITTTDTADQALLRYLTQSPDKQQSDRDELLRWCIEITHLARKNDYLTSTADAIAIYQTSIMLANLRNRPHPSPYDFQDAAITCLEKDFTPKKRDIHRLTEIMLGGDRIGRVGYHSLPPLARDVYDRLAPLPIKLDSRTVQRALLDFNAKPGWRPASDLLWKLRYLLDDYACRPIMGQRKLGFIPQQESWDIAIGKYQRAIIELGYEGVTIEQVLEQRLRQKVYHAKAQAAPALEAVEDSILFLKSDRLTNELGERAVELLSREETADGAQEIFQRIRDLLHYYRTHTPGLPAWLNDFVRTGYSHYCTMLPEAFADKEAPPAQLAAMLGFILTLENLALSLGCSREQLLIAIKQSTPSDHAKESLLWTAEYLLNLRQLDTIREHFDRVLHNPLLLPSLPDSLNGFIAAQEFSPAIAGFTVELLSKCLGILPDEVLIPWLPHLLINLKANRPELNAKLLNEATALFPADLAQLDTWRPPWEQQPLKPNTTKPVAPTTPTHPTLHNLLKTHPETTDTLADLLNLDPTWGTAEDLESPAEESPPPARSATTHPLLEAHPESLQALAKLV